MKLSRLKFILLGIGLIVGGAKLWRDPSEIYNAGGLLYIFVYAIFLILLALPLLYSEIVLGRLGQTPNVVHAFTDITRRSNRSKLWVGVAYFGVLNSFLIAGLILVVTLWTISFFPTVVMLEVGSNSEHLNNYLLSALAFTPAKVGLAAILCALIFFYFNYSQKTRLLKIMPIMVVIMLTLIFSFLIYALFSGLMTEPMPQSLANVNGVSGTAYVVNMFDDLEVSDTLSKHTFLGILNNALQSSGAGLMVICCLSGVLAKNANSFEMTTRLGVSSFFIVQITCVSVLPILFLQAEFSGGLSMWFVDLQFGLSLTPWGKLFSGISLLIVILTMATSALLMLEPAAVYMRDRFGLFGIIILCVMILALMLLMAGSEVVLSFVDQTLITTLTNFVAIAVLIFVFWRLPKKLLSPHVVTRRTQTTMSILEFYRIPGIKSLLGSLFGLIISKVLAMLLTQQWDFIPGLVLVLMFALSVFWDLISWIRSEGRSDVRVITYWGWFLTSKFIAPILTVVVIIYGFWFIF